MVRHDGSHPHRLVEFALIRLPVAILLPLFTRANSSVTRRSMTKDETECGCTAESCQVRGGADGGRHLSLERMCSFIDFRTKC